MRNLRDSKDKGYVNLSRIGRSIYEVTDLSVKFEERFKGVGTELMRQVCRDADKEQVTLRLLASSGDARVSQEQLMKWYSRFGFVQESDDNTWMRREPRLTAQQLQTMDDVNEISARMNL